MATYRRRLLEQKTGRTSSVENCATTGGGNEPALGGIIGRRSKAGSWPILSIIAILHEHRIAAAAAASSVWPVQSRT